MTTVTHTAQCDAGTTAAAAWRELWPGHCERCHGHGSLEVSQQHPWGSTFATEYWSEPCACVEDLQCPRCGLSGLLWDDDQSFSICAACGWLGSVVTEQVGMVRLGYAMPDDPKSEGPVCCMDFSEEDR